MKQTLILSFFFLYSLLVLGGCADMPQTGSISMPADVDRYIVRPDAATICLQTDVDSRCFTRRADGNGPIVHIHPRKLVYEFYYQGDQILRAQRAMDTTALRQTFSGAEQGSPRGNPDLGDGNPNTDADDFGDAAELFSGDDGWFIRLYYPEGRTPTQRMRRLEESGLQIKINGSPISSTDIEGFARTTGPRGTAIQFFYPDVSGDASQLTVEVTGLVAADETVTFYVDPLTESI